MKAERHTSTPDKIARWIRRRGPGTVFTPADLERFGTRAAVDQALSRLARQGVIRRLGRGIYDLPKVSPRLGPLTPSAEEIAAAVARREGVRVQVSGAKAANALGLTTQVPARTTFLTEGSPRTRRIAGQVVEFRRAVPRRLAGAGSTAAAVIEAVRHLGRDAVIAHDVEHLVGGLSPAERRQLDILAGGAPLWVRRVIRQAVAPTPDADN